MKFSYLKDKNTILNGSIDLLSINGENAVIIDYKSDSFPWDIEEIIKHDILIEKYKKQLDEYESTVRTLIPNIKNIEKKIIFFTDYSRKNGTIKVNEMSL